MRKIHKLFDEYKFENVNLRNDADNIDDTTESSYDDKLCQLADEHLKCKDKLKISRVYKAIKLLEEAPQLGSTEAMRRLYQFYTNCLKLIMFACST